MKDHHADQEIKQSGNSDSIDSFPNYHPLIVHFPLMLLLLAAAMQIVIMFFDNKLYNYTVVLFTIGGFIGALLATFVFHAHPADDINLKAKSVFSIHKKLAYATIWLSGIASLLKIVGVFVTFTWIEIIALLFLIGCAITVSLGGHHGAELVYKHGIGPKGEKLEHTHQ